MKIEDLLIKKVSYQTQFWKEITDKNIESVFAEIKGTKHETYTKSLRKLYLNEDIATYSVKKRMLPVATFCGAFDKIRTKQHLREYNSILILDIDKLGIVELERVKHILSNDKYVFSFWESPSKDGIKGLVHLIFQNNFERELIDQMHKAAFAKLYNYFKENYSIELDKSGNDFTRLCFISHDENIVVKSEFKSFEINETISFKKNPSNNRKSGPKAINSPAINILFNPIGKNSPYQKRIILNIIAYLKKNAHSITNAYDDWLRVAFAIANTFTFDIGLRYFKELSRLDITKYNEYECEAFLKNCYEYSKGIIQFTYIIRMAIDKGFKYKNINTEST